MGTRTSSLAASGMCWPCRVRFPAGGGRPGHSGAFRREVARLLGLLVDSCGGAAADNEADISMEADSRWARVASPHPFARTPEGERDVRVKSFEWLSSVACWAQSCDSVTPRASRS